MAFSRARSSRMPSLAERTRGQRMGPARLAEPPHERRVAGLEEDQHRVQPGHLPQPTEDPGKRREEIALTDVNDDGDLLDVAAAPQRQGRHCRNQRRRQVVDAEVAEILERADGLRLAGPGEPGEHDERLARVACVAQPLDGLPVGCGSAPSSRSSRAAFVSPRLSRLEFFVLLLVGRERGVASVRSRRSASARAA